MLTVIKTLFLHEIASLAWRSPSASNHLNKVDIK